MFVPHNYDRKSGNALCCCALLLTHRPSSVNFWRSAWRVAARSCSHIAPRPWISGEAPDVLLHEAAHTSLLVRELWQSAGHCVAARACSHVAPRPWISGEARDDCCAPTALLSRFRPCRLYFVPSVQIRSERSPTSNERRDVRKFATGPTHCPANPISRMSSRNKKHRKRCIGSVKEYFERDKSYWVANVLKRKFRFFFNKPHSYWDAGIGNRDRTESCRVSVPSIHRRLVYALFFIKLQLTWMYLLKYT
jgi:hypothetical protein